MPTAPGAVRLFVAALVDAATRERIAALPDPPRGFRRIDPRNYHVTLRFLGSIDGTRVPALQHALRDGLRMDTCDGSRMGTCDGLRAAPDTGGIRATGWMELPSPSEPRVLALRLQSGGMLERLAAAVDQALSMDFGAREQPFQAHISVARRTRQRRLAGQPALPALPGPVTVGLEAFGLYRSIAIPGGVRYQRLK